MGCTDPNDEDVIAVTRVLLKICWHKLLARINNVLFRTTVRKNLPDPSFPLPSNACSCHHFEMYNFRQFDTRVTNAETKEHLTKGDY